MCLQCNVDRRNRAAKTYVFIKLPNLLRRNLPSAAETQFWRLPDTQCAKMLTLGQNCKNGPPSLFPPRSAYFVGGWDQILATCENVTPPAPHLGPRCQVGSWTTGPHRAAGDVFACGCVRATLTRSNDPFDTSRLVATLILHHPSFVE